MSSESVAITEMLQRAAGGDPAAAERLYAEVYAALRALAGRHLRGERAGLTLQATDLVHEAYLRLVDQTRSPWRNRAHFLAVASLAMRRILVDHARGKARAKRGGGRERVPLDEALALGTPDGAEALVDLDAALARLAAAEPERARVVELIVFGGLTHAEVAEVLAISPRTVARAWAFGQAWLYRELAGEPPAQGAS